MAAHFNIVIVVFVIIGGSFGGNGSQCGGSYAMSTTTLDFTDITQPQPPDNTPGVPVAGAATHTEPLPEVARPGSGKPRPPR